MRIIQYLISAVVIFVLSLSLAPIQGFAEWAADPHEKNGTDQDIDKVDIYLVTVGLGDDLYTRFGHSILRVVNNNNRTEKAYNWGIFDFNNDPVGFGIKFFKGILIYQVGVQGFPQLVRFYRDIEQRSMVQEKINLSPGQKSRLLQRIAWNLKPENIKYDYQYFFNNCSTKIRDYLDEALQGKVKDSFLTVSAGGITHRDYVRSFLASSPYVVMGLDIFMNSRIDRPISLWEEMFLPAKLRQHLSSLTAYSEDGHPLPNTHLLSETMKIIPEGYHPVYPMNTAYCLTLLIIGLPVLICLLVMFTRFLKGIKPGESSLAHRLFGCSLLLWGALSGFFGVILVLTWTLSAHLDLHHDANLFAFWPIDWLGIYIGGVFLINGGTNSSSWFRHFGLWFAGAHLLALLVFALAWTAGLIQQDVSRVILFLGSFSAGLYFLLLIFSKIRNKATI